MRFRSFVLCALSVMFVFTLVIGGYCDDQRVSVDTTGQSEPLVNESLFTYVDESKLDARSLESLNAIREFKPKNVWHYFFQLTQTPRPSFQYQQVNDFLKAYANHYKFEVIEDEAHNIIVRVPATEGYENVPTVAIQSHTDMVSAMNKGTEHDFSKDSIIMKSVENGKFVRADGTTLGADNGMGCACMLAIAADPSIKHGKLELLFTSDEEVGLLGASKLNEETLTAKMLINLDTEEREVFYIGCAGGQTSEATLNDLKTETVQLKDSKIVDLKIKGLTGGHSGADIHMQKGNANKILGSLLFLIKSKNIPFNIASLEGGNAHNVIPRESFARIVVKDPKHIEDIKDIVLDFEKDTQSEYEKTDKDLNVEFSVDTSGDDSSIVVYTDAETDKIVKLYNAMPHGAQSMSHSIEGLVETSTNFAKVDADASKNAFKILTSQRSSRESALTNIIHSVRSVFELAGAEVKYLSRYPAWQPNVDSPFLKIGVQVHKKLFNKEPKVAAIHAGLETGLLKAKFPDLDMLSFGPAILNAHSPTEYIVTDDVIYTYDLLKGVLEELSKQQ